jgi:hypothetical protein
MKPLPWSFSTRVPVFQHPVASPMALFRSYSATHSSRLPIHPSYRALYSHTAVGRVRWCGMSKQARSEWSGPAMIAVEVRP